MLRVDLVEHAGEAARFWAKVVKGPGSGTAGLGTGAIAVEPIRISIDTGAPE